MPDAPIRLRALADQFLCVAFELKTTSRHCSGQHALDAVGKEEGVGVRYECLWILRARPLRPRRQLERARAQCSPHLLVLRCVKQSRNVQRVLVGADAHDGVQRLGARERNSTVGVIALGEQGLHELGSLLAISA